MQFSLEHRRGGFSSLAYEDYTSPTMSKAYLHADTCSDRRCAAKFTETLADRRREAM